MKRQVDYNKIANNISKYSFSFDLTVTETYENFSKEYPEIYTIFFIIKKCLLDDVINNVTPFFIQDNQTPTGAYLITSVSFQDNTLMLEGFDTYNNINNSINFEYNFNSDILYFVNNQEEFLSSDNVKSVFNQSITGTGNITLFRHKLTLNYTSESGSPGYVYLDWLSTSNLNVDSLQDLQTLLKVSRNDTSDTSYLGYNSYTTSEIAFIHSTGVFKITDEYNSYNVTGVSDKVTTI